MTRRATHTQRNPRSPLRRGVVIVLRLTLIVSVAWLVIGYLMQRRVMFPRGMAVQVPNAKDGTRDLEVLWLDTDGGRVEAWLLLGAGASADSPKPAVIFAHGNAELIDHNVGLAQRYQLMGVSVLLVEYRGYGRSGGSPSQEAITADMIAFYDLLAKRGGVDATRIIFHGRSLGGGAACALALQRKPAAIILESTFTSAKDMAWRFAIPPFLVRDPFDNQEVLAQLDAPVLLFHGRRDNIIPYEHGVALSQTAKNAQLVSYDCDHNDLPPDHEDYWVEIQKFLREAGVMR